MMKKITPTSLALFLFFLVACIGDINAQATAEKKRVLVTVAVRFPHEPFYRNLFYLDNNSNLITRKVTNVEYDFVQLDKFKRLKNFGQEEIVHKAKKALAPFSEDIEYSVCEYGLGCDVKITFSDQDSNLRKIVIAGIPPDFFLKGNWESLHQEQPDGKENVARIKEAMSKNIYEFLEYIINFPTLDVDQWEPKTATVVITKILESQYLNKEVPPNHQMFYWDFSVILQPGFIPKEMKVQVPYDSIRNKLPVGTVNMGKYQGRYHYTEDFPTSVTETE